MGRQFIQPLDTDDNKDAFPAPYDAYGLPPSPARWTASEVDTYDTHGTGSIGRNRLVSEVFVQTS